MRLDFLQSHAWQVSLGRFVILLATAFLIGLPWNAQLYTLLAATFGYCIWSLVTLYQVQSWLRSRKRRGPLEDRGVWSDISTYVHSRLSSERSRKRRLVGLLRAFSEGAAALPDGVRRPHPRPQRAVVQRSGRTTARACRCRATGVRTSTRIFRPMRANWIDGDAIASRCAKLLRHSTTARGFRFA